MGGGGRGGGGGGVSLQLILITLSQAVRQIEVRGEGEGGGLHLISGSCLPISLLLSASLPLFFFNVSFAYFWLAVRLFLDKNEIDRIPTQPYFIFDDERNECSHVHTIYIISCHL